MTVSFVHLRLHTEYSLEDSVIRIPSLVEKAKILNLPALALTDQMNLFAAVKFYQAVSTAGIKPILGVDAYLMNPKTVSKPFRCTLLCQNNQGYQHLLELISKGYQKRSRAYPVVLQQSWLDSYSEGLIMLSGGLYGEIGQALIQKRKAEAEKLVEHWKNVFHDRFYLELQRMGHAEETHYIKAACQLAQHHQVPVVATHDVRFLMAEDFEAHETRVCIQQGSTIADTNRPKLYTAEQYLKSAEEMGNLFADIPSALKNTVEIAKRCNVELPLNQVHLPHFPVPEGLNAEDYLIQKAEEGLEDRLRESSELSALAIRKSPIDIKSQSASSDLIESGHKASYIKRLKSELEVINSMGFASYFLIVADFIRWAKSEKIPVGPGRGSGAGSLVAYALKITDLDPLHYNLLFERFLNAERVSLPDFDIDFCMEHRDRVITYVMERYGLDAVAQIITFGTMAARAVIRDVGRALGYPYGMVDSIAKLIPFEVGITLDKALERDENASYGLRARYNQEEEIRILIDLAKKLEGLVRNAGTHAGGVVIAPTRLTEFTALYCESENANLITQLDKDDIETMGLVKFDFLGLRTLTIIEWAVDMINQKRIHQGEPVLAMNHLPLDDKRTFDLFCACQVTAVFQLESRGIRGLLKRLKPDHFEDIVALIALFRPGPLQSGMVDDFIQRKHDSSQVRYPHSLLEPILAPTYGVILYQEQVMQIAQVLAGYSLGSADLLRRAMGKKKPQEMAKQRAFFISGAEKKGIDKVFANTMFDLIEKFAGYGFNKSHSVAYALISYQTAWLKAHYPTEFMAAVLSSEMEHTEKLASLLYECRSLGVKVNLPSLYRSQYAFTVNDKGEIEYGLGAIKGLGKTAIEHLLNIQQASGNIQNLFDLCRRIDNNKVNRRALEALIYSGSLDDLDEDRGALLGQLDVAMRAAVQQSSAHLEKQNDLFGMVQTTTLYEHIAIKPLELKERWKKEKDTLGLYLKDHPISEYQEELKNFKYTPLSDLYSNNQSRLSFAAWLVSFKVKSTARGDRFVILLVEDQQHRVEIRLSNELYQTSRDFLVKDNLLIGEIETRLDKITQEVRITVQKLSDITHLRSQHARYLAIRISTTEYIKWLHNHLKTAESGTCPIVIEYHTAKAKLDLQLGEKWKVKPTDTLLTNLRKQFKLCDVWIQYG